MFRFSLTTSASKSREGCRGGYYCVGPRTASGLSGDLIVTYCLFDRLVSIAMLVSSLLWPMSTYTWP